MRPRATALALVTTAAAVAGSAGFAHEPAAPAEDPFPGVVEQIEAIQKSRGINSPELIDPLTSFGLMLREEENLGLATAAFERARHLVRVNYGLSSFEEAPLLRQLMQIEERKGNAEAAWHLEQQLLGLIRRYPGPRAAPLLKEIADKRADVLRQYSAGEFPPQIMLGCYYAWGYGSGCPHSGSSRTVKVRLLHEARSYYLHTIAMVLHSEGLSAEELPELFLALVRALYAFPSHSLTESEGRAILVDVHSLAVRNAQPLAVQMDALLQIADWDLVFARGRDANEAAFQAYEALYDRMKREGLEASAIDAMFSPSVPVAVPAFLPNPFSSTDAARSSAYIDVAFDITKHGDGRSVEILDTTTSTTEDARLRVREIIKWSRFRPRVADGSFEDPSRVVVRYYVNE